MTQVGSLHTCSALEHRVAQTGGDKMFNTLDTETLIDTDLRNAS